jgi:hypothetical protein
MVGGIHVRTGFDFVQYSSCLAQEGKNLLAWKLSQISLGPGQGRRNDKPNVLVVRMANLFNAITKLRGVFLVQLAMELVSIHGVSFN